MKVLAFLHIGSLGLPSMNVGELEDVRYIRVADTVEVIERNRDVIVGVKARLGRAPAGDNVMVAARAAIAAAAEAGLPVMFHVSGGADLRQILPMMRGGDLMTHTFTAADDGNGLLFTADGRLLPELLDARERGVVFDIGHGCGSFAWPIVRRAMDLGFEPTTISTDLHRLCITGPAFDMATTMAKMLHVGWSVTRAVEATHAPPRARPSARGRTGLAGRRAGRERGCLPPRGPRDPAHGRVRHHGARRPAADARPDREPGHDRAPGQTSRCGCASTRLPTSKWTAVPR